MSFRNFKVCSFNTRTLIFSVGGPNAWFIWCIGLIVASPPPDLPKSMALLQDQLHEINQIAEDLDSCERKRLLYLCDSMETDSSVARVKEMLRSKIQRQENSHLFLRELMLRVGRYDILRKVCKVSKDQVERDPQVIPRFRYAV